MAAEDINQKSQELARSLWAIACDLRGSMDSSKFKNYILELYSIDTCLKEQKDTWMTFWLRTESHTSRH